MATVDINPDPHKANMRQRALLTSDEIVNPQDGTCHIFSRFVQTNYAAQVILKAQLTRLYERDDWKERLRHPAYTEPLRLERRLASHLNAPTFPSDTGSAKASKDSDLLISADAFSQEANQRMNTARAQPIGIAAAAGVQVTSLEVVQKRHAAVEQAGIE